MNGDGSCSALVGNNPSSETYVKMKGNACEKVGIKSIRIQLDATIETEILLNERNKLNEDKMFTVYCCSIQYLIILMKERHLKQLV